MDFDLVTLKYVLENRPDFRNRIADKLATIATDHALLATNLDNKSIASKVYNTNQDPSRKIKAAVRDVLKKHPKGLNAQSIYSEVLRKTDVTIARNTIYWYLNKNSTIVRENNVFKLKTHK